MKVVIIVFQIASILPYLQSGYLEYYAPVTSILYNIATQSFSRTPFVLIENGLPRIAVVLAVPTGGISVPPTLS